MVIQLERGCDVEAASTQRAQWWAEALHRYRAGERANLPRALMAEAEAVAEQHRAKDALEEDVREAAVDLDGVAGFTMRDLHDTIAGHGAKPADWPTQKRYGAALRNLGFSKQKVQHDGVRGMLWFAPAAGVPTRDPAF